MTDAELHEAASRNGSHRLEILDRIPPSAPGSEAGVLGSILLRPPLIADVAGILKAADFYDQRKARIYAHMLEMWAAGIAVDLTLLGERLMRAGEYDEVGGLSHLQEIFNATAVSAHWQHYAHEVRDASIRRQLILQAVETLQDVYRSTDPAAAIAGRARDRFDCASTEAIAELFPVQTCAELVAENPDTPFYIDNLFAELQPLTIGGPMKSMKTSLLVALAFSLATGSPFLGCFPIRRSARFVLLSAESGKRALQDLLIRVGRAMGLDPAQVTSLFVGYDVPQVDNPEHEAAIRRLLLDCEAEVIAFDPFYLGADEESQSNQVRQGRQLRRLCKICLDLGVTPIICQHTKKNTYTKYGPLDLSDLHGAGTGEFTRQFWLINRRCPYREDGQHELWLKVGGSLGHSMLRAVDIDEGVWEGPGTRRWDVTVMTEAEARQTSQGDRQSARDAERAEKRQAELDADRREVVTIMLRLGPDTKNKSRDAFPYGHRRFDRAFGDLAADGTIEPCDVRKGNNQTYQGWRVKAVE